jgi:hypothetical protein
MAKETHKSRLLAYLQHYGSITSLEAIRDLGNTRLAASIFLLKEDGYNIKTSDASVPTRWTNEDGTKRTTTVAKYTLEDEKIWKSL